MVARFDSLTSDWERFLPWRAVQDEEDRPLVEYEMETLIRGLFDPADGSLREEGQKLLDSK